jgi:hypothetical protein
MSIRIRIVRIHEHDVDQFLIIFLPFFVCLESMSMVEEYGAASRTLSSILEKDVSLTKQFLEV